MHCKQCGAEINDGAKFCGVCGTPTVAAAASTAGDAIYVEARPIESQSVEAQFQAAEDAEAAACLQDSLRESIGSLTRASVISLLYVLFFNYVLGGGSLGLDYMILLGLLLIGPWKVIISLYRSGVRLPFVYGGVACNHVCLQKRADEPYRLCYVAWFWGFGFCGGFDFGYHVR